MIKSQNVILLNDFNKIRESGIRYREYYLLDEFRLLICRVGVSQLLCTE